MKKPNQIQKMEYFILKQNFLNKASKMEQICFNQNAWQVWIRNFMKQKHEVKNQRK